MTYGVQTQPSRRERRLSRRVAGRGEAGLVEALLELKGSVFGSRYRCDTLYDIGAEGAVFLVTDRIHPDAAPRVAKLPLLPFHRPIEMTQETVAERRAILAVEASHLMHCGAPSLPKHLGHFDFTNPLLDARRGGEFDAPDPVLVMERLPGHDLDRWLARVHRSGVPFALLRPTLDRVVVGLLRALVDLLDRRLIYADLRPANLRLLPRPRRHVRLLDAGSLVPVYDKSGRFPHVPAYLPPATLDAIERGEPVYPTAAIQAVMCGRTLYEIATGNVPRPGEPIDESALIGARVSAPIADVVRRLAAGKYERVHEALAYLEERARAVAVRQRQRTRASSRVAPAPASASGSQMQQPAQPVQAAVTEHSATTPTPHVPASRATADPGAVRSLPQRPAGQRSRGILALLRRVSSTLFRVLGSGRGRPSETAGLGGGVDDAPRARGRDGDLD